LNRLVDKGLASKTGRPAEYSAAIDRQQAQAGHLDQFISKLSGGSVVPLVAQLMQDRQISREELQELKRLIQDAEQNPDGDQKTGRKSGSRNGGRRS
ncbi:MAG: BlaI/MecI/CopY family transcriptional regulator, partial [Planctomycetales bacterium]|nr:BlaI/MecI/CopY family transcriptional regulator [Planctomycetales bacterium]